MTYTESMILPKNEPSLGDFVRISLYKNKFFAAPGIQKDEKDIVPKIYTERTDTFVIHPYVEGEIREIFKNRVTGEVWVTIYNYFRDILFSVPAYNIIEVIVS